MNSSMGSTTFLREHLPSLYTEMMYRVQRGPEGRQAFWLLLGFSDRTLNGFESEILSDIQDSISLDYSSSTIRRGSTHMHQSETLL